MSTGQEKNQAGEETKHYWKKGEGLGIVHGRNKRLTLEKNSFVWEPIVAPRKGGGIGEEKRQHLRIKVQKTRKHVL